MFRPLRAAVCDVRNGCSQPYPIENRRSSPGAPALIPSSPHGRRLDYRRLGPVRDRPGGETVSLSSKTEARLTVTLDRVLEITVPVGLAVLTWLALLVAVGFLARLNSLSVLNVVPVIFVGLLFWPIYRAAPWQPGTTTRVRRWARHQQAEFVIVLGLGLLPLVPFVPDLLVSLLQLPYRGSGVFFGASLFYRERFGSLAGRLVLTFGQTYIQLLWLYLLSKGVIGLVRRLR